MTEDTKGAQQQADQLKVDLELSELKTEWLKERERYTVKDRFAPPGLPSPQSSYPAFRFKLFCVCTVVALYSCLAFVIDTLNVFDFDWPVLAGLGLGGSGGGLINFWRYRSYRDALNRYVRAEERYKEKRAKIREG